MTRIQELTLMHLAFLALFACCLLSAQRFDLPAFYPKYAKKAPSFRSGMNWPLEIETQVRALC